MSPFPHAMAKKRNILSEMCKPKVVAWQAFELEVAHFMEKSILQGKWGIHANTAIVKRKPKYFSRDREKAIVFDVSVEVCPVENPGELLLLWLIECKDYPDRKVEVGEVEEFHTKMLQVRASKGTIFTRFGFDSGALTYAKSHRIGLATLQKEAFCSIQLSASGGFYSETRIKCPLFVDDNEVRYDSLTDAIEQIMAPFSIQVFDVILNKERVTYDGKQLVYVPLDDADRVARGD